MSSQLMNEINYFTKTPPGFKPYFFFTTILHTEKKDLNENDGVYIASLLTDDNYVEDGSGYYEISIYCKPGTYMYDVYPYADNLELTLIRLKQQRSGGQVTKFEQRFKAVFLLDKNTNLPSNTNGNRDLLNRQPPFVITLQLVDLGALAIRNSVVQGSYSDLISEKNKDMSYSSLMKSIFSTLTSRIKIDNRPVLDSVTIEDANNEQPIKAITIPTGTKALELPKFLQEKKGGVYNAGIGSYVSFFSRSPSDPPKRVLFVYSLYSGKKFDKSDNQIVFFVPPSGKADFIDCTYSYRANVLKCVTGPSDGLASTKGAVLRNEGEGFRSANANVIMEAPLELKEDGPRYKKRQILTEVTSKKQDDGVTLAPYKGISNNHFVNTSEIMARSGQYIVLVVNNLDPDFLFPGAPCQINFDLGNGMIEEMLGVLHKVTTRYEYFSQTGITEGTTTRHALHSKVAVTIYVTDIKS